MQAVVEFVAAVGVSLGLAMLSALGVGGCEAERRVEAVVRKQAVSTLPQPVANFPAPSVHRSIPC